MLVYSWGMPSKLLGSETVDHACETCGHPQAVVAVRQRYFQFCWVPMFPLPKSVIVGCPNCRSGVDMKTLFTSDYDRFMEIRKRFRTPFYWFAGLALVLAFVVSIIVMDQSNRIATRRLHHSPRAGDRFVFEKDMGDAKHPYHVGRIDQVAADRLSISLARFDYEAPSDAINEIKALKPGDYVALEKPIPQSIYDRLDVPYVERGQ